jgi:hypothetical protein
MSGRVSSTTDRATRSVPPARTRLASLVPLVVALLAVLGAVAALRAVSRDAATTAGDELALGHSSLVVGAVTPEVMKHPKGMPASMMPDPIPDGFQRFSVDVTVYADEGAAASYDARRIRVTDPKGRSSAPVRGTLGSGTIPAGGQVRGSVLFQLPAEVRTVSMSVVGDAGRIRVRIPAGAGHTGHQGD